MNIKKVIYKDGEGHLETTVYKDQYGVERCAYTGYLRKLDNDLTVPEYLSEKPDAVCISFDDALERIAKAEDAAYIKPWTEITEDQWMDALEVLPPQKWQTVNGVELFRMSEYTTGNITTHYARIGERCFCANRRTSDAYEKLAAEVQALQEVAA